jgi:hypothetical protein
MQAGRCATLAVLGTGADMQIRHTPRAPPFHHALHPQPNQYATLRPRLARNPSGVPARFVPCRAKASADPLSGLRILEWTGSPSEVQVGGYILEYESISDLKVMLRSRFCVIIIKKKSNLVILFVYH